MNVATKPPANAPDVVENLLKARWSCRSFKPEPLPQDIIDRILTMSQHTASWCNSQPWKLVVTSGKATEELRQKMHARGMTNEPDDSDFPYPREYRGVYQERRRESGFQLYDAVGIGHKDMPARTMQALENYNFFGAPHVAIIHTDEPLGIYGAVDCGAYVGNFMLAAQALGLGTIPQAALARHSGLIRRHFNLASDRKVVCGISFGFADHAAKVNSYRTSRASVADTVTFVD